MVRKFKRRIVIINIMQTFAYLLLHLNLLSIAELRDNKQGEDHCLEDNQFDLGLIISEDKRIYENQISELVADRLLSDSKASHFYLECIALQKRVQSREKKKVNSIPYIFLAYKLA